MKERFLRSEPAKCAGSPVEMRPIVEGSCGGDSCRDVGHTAMLGDCGRMRLEV
jgi:hypothetical protein